jgi:hemin uptake protein HemP
VNQPHQPAVPQAELLATQPQELPKVIVSKELFEGEREVCIVHEGETYRLRITRRNKLILQK